MMIAEESDWYLALHSAERIADLRRSGVPVEAAGLDTEAAEWRLSKLRAQSPFSDPAFFARRLAMDGLTEAELLALFGEAGTAIQARASGEPSWLGVLEEAFRDFASGDLPPLPDGLRRDPG